MIIRTHGIILGLSSPSFCKILSQNKARVIIVQEIKTVPYRRIDDQIIHRIHHQIKVVKATTDKTLSFLINAYGNATTNNINIIIHTNPTSV